MKSFSTLEVYLVRVCSAGLQSNAPWQPVMLGINGPQQNRRAHSTSVVVTERENMCVCVRVCMQQRGKKGQKTAWKEQYRYYWIKSGNGSIDSRTILALAKDETFVSVFLLFWPCKIKSKTVCEQPRTVCVYVVNKPRIWHVKRDVLY